MPITEPAPRPLKLRISDPASLLNEIANRYEDSVERVLMEYIDNSIDDAEGLYRANADSYPYSIQISITIDRAQRSVTVRDNCRGMSRETLERIVENVGESQKKGSPWLNGRFGFGVHAFRADAGGIIFQTRQAGGQHLQLHVQRNQEEFDAPTERNDAFPSSTGTGTQVVIGPFQQDSLAPVTPRSIQQEIELHFERLLARPGLQITVQEDSSPPLACEPFDYGQVPGEEFERVLDLGFDHRIFTVDVHLKVASIEVPGRRARFFNRGRRVNEVHEIKSFMRSTTHRAGVWGHPQLLGFIEVADLVTPVITRDEFVRGRGRKILYEAICGLEEEIKEALDRVNEAQRDSRLNRLEDLVQGALNGLAREDRLRLRTHLVPGFERGAVVAGGEDNATGDSVDRRESQEGPSQTTDSRDATTERPDRQDETGHHGASGDNREIVDEPDKGEGTPRRRSGFEIRFVNLPPDPSGRWTRSTFVDGIIYINTGHPDWQERVGRDRRGRETLTDRLGAYVAATISIHYKDQFYLRYGRQPERRDQMFDEQVDFMCRLEEALHPNLALLQRQFMSANGAGVGHDDTL